MGDFATVGNREKEASRGQLGIPDGGAHRTLPLSWPLSNRMAGGPKEGEIFLVVDIIDGPTEEQEGGSTLNANKEREALRRIHEDPKLSRFLEELEKYLEHAAAHVESKNFNPIEVEVECLLQIEKDPKLNRALIDWEKQFKAALSRIEKKRTRSINTKNELYQLIGFYSVFQGVVLTAVAQTNLIRCSQSWGPASLSLLASVATIAGVYAKLKDYSELRCALEDETNDSKVSVSIFREISLVEFLRTLVEMVLLCRRAL